MVAYVKQSNIDGANYGVFANKVIPKNRLITKYDGKSFDLKDDEFLNYHLLEIIKSPLDDEDKKFILTHNAYKITDNKKSIYGYNYDELKYLNSTAYGSLVNHSYKPNATLVLSDNGISIISLKKIKKDDEITIDYGNNYWIQHTINKLWESFFEKTISIDWNTFVRDSKYLTVDLLDIICKLGNEFTYEGILPLQHLIDPNYEKNTNKNPYCTKITLNHLKLND